MTDKASLADQALLEILNRTLQAGDFMAEQAPLVVQELINYKTISHVIGFIFLGALAAFFVFASNRLYRKSVKLKNDRGDGEEHILLAGIAALLCLMFAYCTVSELIELIKVIIAPRVYLLEYTATLVK